MRQYEIDIRRNVGTALPVVFILALLTAALNLLTDDYIYFSLREVFRLELGFVPLSLLFFLTSISFTGIFYILTARYFPKQFPEHDSGVITTAFLLFTSTVSSIVAVSFFWREVFPVFALNTVWKIGLSILVILNCIGAGAVLSFFLSILLFSFLKSYFPPPNLRKMYILFVPVIVILMFCVFLANDIKEGKNRNVLPGRFDGENVAGDFNERDGALKEPVQEIISPVPPSTSETDIVRIANIPDE